MLKINEILALVFAALLLGCSGDNDGNSDTKPISPVVNNPVSLTQSKQGLSGGFVDVDGDGSEDKVVGAPYAKVGGNTGALLVYFRTPDGFEAQPGLTLKGGDNFGYSFSNLGDVDGDATDDFAVGAINGDSTNPGGTSLCGTVTIYKGGSANVIIKVLSGVAPLDKFGFTVDGGDLNGDGFNDVAVGAPFNSNDPALFGQGAVYAFFGPDLDSSVALYASSTTKGLGWSLEVGDIDGDSTDDLLLGAAGKVLGFYGKESFAPVLASPDVTITGTAAGFGRALKVLADLTADGYNEFAVCAPTAVINNARDTGCVYIIKGASGPRIIDLSTTPTDLLARICGGGGFERFGASIEKLGDLDNDGTIDYAIGAPMADCGLKLMGGRVYCFKGKDLGPTTTVAQATAFDAVVKDQGYGTFLAANADGKLLIGAPRSNADTGGVGMVDAKTGQTVTGGSSGGDTGGGGDCH